MYLESLSTTMWELIRRNKRKSIILFICMGCVLILLGYLVGSVFFPPHGGVAGVGMALCLWVLMSVVAYFSGDSIFLNVSHAQEVSHDIHPQLYNVVEEMKIASNFTHMPRIYIIDEPAPNAFATGVKPEKSTVVVTAGLLSRLNRDELQGVIAHEMSHIVNRDVLFVTFAGILLGSIVLISQVFLRSMWFSGGSSRRYRSGKRVAGGQAQLVLVAASIAFAILAPILTRLLYFAISRKREYLADASAVRLTRYPEGLASALEKISSNRRPLSTANKVTAPMYIINPLRAKSGGVSGLFSTHPPIGERIAILRSMAHRVNYLDYQRAYSKVRGKKDVIIPGSGLKDTESVPIRQASKEGPVIAGPKKKDVRDLGDLMRAINQYAFLTCACGLKIKVPPDYEGSEISCPRCGRHLELPAAELAAVKAAVDSAGIGGEKAQRRDAPRDRPMVYARRGHGWETFSCACGRRLQISPAFDGSHVTCGTCGRKTLIKEDLE